MDKTPKQCYDSVKHGDDGKKDANHPEVKISFLFVKVISAPEWRYGNWDDGVILKGYASSSLGVKSMLFGSMQ